MKDLDPWVFIAVFQEMLGIWLWVILAAVTIGLAAFIWLLARERTVVARRLVWSQVLGVPAGVVALLLMFKVSSSGFPHMGGPIDWLLMVMVFIGGFILSTIVFYTAGGCWRRCRPAARARHADTAA